MCPYKKHLNCAEPPEVVELVFTAGPEVAVGRTAELQCTAFGVPAPTLWWEVTGPATFTVTNSSSANSTSSVLEVSPVALSHHGPVSCTASNGVGPPASSTINLTVLCRHPHPFHTFVYLSLVHFCSWSGGDSSSD